MSGAPLSRFTPSLMPHDVLERLFVVRDRTLDAVMERVVAAATTEGRNHTLLIGPRGAGKTHLVSLVYHRTKQLQADGTRLQPAWLPEDPWTLVSYRHLLAEIAKRAEPKFDSELPREAGDLEAHLAQRAAEGGPLVVIVENLDQILEALGNEGQQRLRHLLQVDRSLLLVATSTRLDRSLSDQASPFYGFFTTTRLEPFDPEEAAAMLTAIATDRHDERLVEYLAGDEGRTRLRTICHLAGGQPRMWAALASALTVEGLGELVELLLARFDDLTPYYQEQLARLSAQQRIVVAGLAELDRPINVKELAERLEIDQRSLSKTISELVDRGWAIPTTSSVTKLLDQRRTYYELAEPLARLSFQIKESRGEPLRLVVEFLKHWFDPEDLAGPQPAGLATSYLVVASQDQQADPIVAVTRRLQRLPVTRGSAVDLLAEIDVALSALTGTDPEPFLRLPTPVRAVLEDKIASVGAPFVRIEIHSIALREFGYTRHPAIASWIERAQELVTDRTSAAAPFGQLFLAEWLGHAWRFEEANEVLAAASTLEGATGDAHTSLRLTVESHLAQARWEAGHTEQAIASSERLVERYIQHYGSDHPSSLNERRVLGAYLYGSGQEQRAIDVISDTVEVWRKAFGDEHPDTLRSKLELVHALAAAERHAEAIELGTILLTDFERVLGPAAPETIAARDHVVVSLADSGRGAEGISILEPIVHAREPAPWLSTEAGLDTRGALVMAYVTTGRLAEALEDSETLIGLERRILGPDDPRTLGTMYSIGMLQYLGGMVDQGTALVTEALAIARQTLGRSHELTLAMEAANWPKAAHERGTE
jgi:DNA-binding MarR family transcriptional regulator/tetratricopeptide (TPR) repeat protein